MSETIRAAATSLFGGDGKFNQESVSSLNGKTAIVTGATKGIGFEVAKTLALAGAKVILLSRKTEHGEEAVKQIKELATKETTSVNIDFKECDLGSLKDVKAVADELASQEQRLDLVGFLLSP